ncbi:MAG: tetratricopeptide repeat protein [Proteobacteria bacterium]|nr:tetratricopeptide repeat protein [Pseudomonadota bacterium]
MVSKYISTIQAYSLPCYTILITIMLSLIPFPALGEIQTITRTVKQPFGGSQSADDARITAVAKAKREALEMAGVYVEGLTVVKNSRVDKDEILALSAGVLKTEVLSQKNYLTGDAFGIEVIVKINVDTSVLEDRVKKLLADRTHLEQLNQARKKEKELLDTVAKLQEENTRLTAEKKSTAQLKRQFQEASQGLTAVDWNNKAIELWQDGKYTDPKKAIEYLNQAIRLKPDYADAHNNRGIAYGKLDKNQQAIEDFSTAINLKQGFAEAYGNRGFIYYYLGQYQRAIEDYNQAIRLKPDYTEAYNSRGSVYAKLGQYQRAIEDYNQTIRLKPDDANAYGNRGAVYDDLGQYQRAIEDYNQTIRLKPDDALSYASRGLAYLNMGNITRGCSDFQKACGLGHSKTCESTKDLCR